MKDIIILGSGGHAKVVIDILTQLNQYRIVGITSVSMNVGTIFLGYSVIGDDSVLSDYKKRGINHVAIGLGGYKNNDARRKLYGFVKEMGLQVINAIHPDSIISPRSIIGEGVTIYPGVTLNTEVRIGNNVILSAGSTVDHETIIEDHVLISTGVSVGAYSCIQEGALLALGSKVIAGVTIGRNSLVAAGAVVVNSIPDNSIVFGIPAK